MVANVKNRRLFRPRFGWHSEVSRSVCLLPSHQFQKILDILRVTGNNAVHPGIINFDDKTPIVSFYEWINIVTDILITQPAEIERVYDNLPEKDKHAIGKRDN